MPTKNARRHTIPKGDEASFTRDVIFSSFGLSINDIIPVANATERAMVIDDLVEKGAGPTAARPVFVARGDAPGLHRVEYTQDGSVWLPVSGVLRFTTKEAADAFGTSSPGRLSVGDRCFAGGVEYRWAGSAGWRLPIARGTFIGNCEANGMVSLAHGLGVTPANVQISYGPVDGISPGDNPNARLFTPVIWDIGPSVIRVRMRREDTHVFLTESQFVAISWQAIA